MSDQVIYKPRKYYIGPSSDYRTNVWDLYCGDCGAKYPKVDVMRAVYFFTFPECGSCNRIDFNEED